MKPFTLLTFLLLMGVGHVIAQSDYSFQLDSTSIASSFQKPSSLGFRIEYESQLPDLLNSLKDNHVMGEQANSFVDKVQITSTVNSMPCYQPKGSFPMLICEPDTTICYSLLIRKE